MNRIDVALICKALSDANRLEIVQMLSEGEKCGCRLLERFEITQPTLSHHMKILVESGMVNDRKDGKWHYYSLNMETLNMFKEFIEKNDAVVISVNFAYAEKMPDFIFLSNLRRFRELPDEQKSKCIVTSNIPSDGVYYQTKYRDLLNDEEAVNDNAGLMAIKFLELQDVSSVYLVGFDGYSHDARENYGNSHMAYITRNAVLDAMNIGMSRVIKEYSKNIDIHFLTNAKHVNI